MALDHADGFRTEWRSGPNGHRTVWVDVFKDGNLVMEWEYGAVCGRSLLKNANLWTAQAILQAKDEMGAAT